MATFERIKHLLEYLPDTSDYYRDILNYTTEINEVNKFLNAYKDLAFGYNFVSALIKDNITIPDEVTEESLVDLYRFLKFRLRNSNTDDLLMALSFTDISNKNMEDCIKAMLISDAEFEEISRITGISIKALQYYEALFFNIRDRKNEALFIANLVYPNSRMIETTENYIKNEDFGKLIIRAAYNHGLDDAAYFSGLKLESSPVSSKASASDMATRLESLIMTNGYFLAKNGFINSKGTSGVSQARNILIAAKQGGQESGYSADDGGLLSMDQAAISALHDIVDPMIEKKLDIIEALETSNLNSETHKSADT